MAFCSISLLVQSQTSSKAPVKEQYCILRTSWIDQLNVWVITEDGKIETQECKESDAQKELSVTMDNIRKIKDKGFSLISSSSYNSGGVQYREYIFKK